MNEGRRGEEGQAALWARWAPDGAGAPARNGAGRLVGSGKGKRVASGSHRHVCTWGSPSGSLTLPTAPGATLSSLCALQWVPHTVLPPLKGIPTGHRALNCRRVRTRLILRPGVGYPTLVGSPPPQPPMGSQSKGPGILAHGHWVLTRLRDSMTSSLASVRQGWVRVGSGQGTPE